MVKADVIEERMSRLRSGLNPLASISIVMAAQAMYYVVDDATLDNLIKTLNNFFVQGLSPDVALPIIMQRPCVELVSSRIIKRDVRGASNSDTRKKIFNKDQGSGYGQRKQKRTIAEISSDVENGLVSADTKRSR